MVSVQIVKRRPEGRAEFGAARCCDGAEKSSGIGISRVIGLDRNDPPIFEFDSSEVHRFAERVLAHQRSEGSLPSTGVAAFVKELLDAAAQHSIRFCLESAIDKRPQAEREFTAERSVFIGWIEGDIYKWRWSRGEDQRRIDRAALCSLGLRNAADSEACAHRAHLFDAVRVVCCWKGRSFPLIEDNPGEQELGERPDREGPEHQRGQNGKADQISKSAPGGEHRVQCLYRKR